MSKAILLTPPEVPPGPGLGERAFTRRSAVCARTHFLQAGQSSRALLVGMKVPAAVPRVPLAGIVLCCAPSILGTLGLLLVPTGFLEQVDVVAEVAVLLFMLAAYGPLLLPVAAGLLATRSNGATTPWTSRLAWGVVTIGVVATAVFHRSLIWTLELP